MAYMMQSEYTGEIVETPKDFIEFRKRIEERLSHLEYEKKIVENQMSPRFSDDEDARYEMERLRELFGEITALKEVLQMFPIIWVKSE